MKEQMPIAEQIKRFEKMKRDFFGEYYDPSMTLMENGDALIERNMQIEEMDTILREFFGCQFAYKINFDKDGGFGGHKEIYTKDIAKAIYNASYRKQKEGEWVQGITGYTCSVCGKQESTNRFIFCPNCGAKMKGGAE